MLRIEGLSRDGKLHAKSGSYCFLKEKLSIIYIHREEGLLLRFCSFLPQ